MKTFSQLSLWFLTAVLWFPSCHDANSIIEREQKEKAEIEQFTKEIKSWDKNSFLKNGVTLEGDPRKLSVKEFYKGIFAEMGVLVDVRTPREYEQAHIPNALSIDFRNENFEDTFSKLDKDVPVFIYCHSGVRSAKATKVLKNMGFKVYNLAHGFKSWVKFNLPVDGEVDHYGGEEGC